MKRDRLYFFIISFLALGLIFSYDYCKKDIKIMDSKEDNTIIKRSFKKNIKEFLDENKIKISKADYINYSKDEKLIDGMDIIIKRARDIKIVDFENEIIVKTYNTKVEDIIKEANIVLNKNDIVEPSLNEEIALDSNFDIKINRVETKFVKKYKDIDFDTIINEDNNLELGKTIVLKKGIKGKKEYVYENSYLNSKLIESKLIKTNLIKESVSKEIKKGTKDYFITSEGEKIQFKKALKVSATAYHAGFESTGKRPGDKYYGMTRSGTQVRAGVIAVDPKVIPLGSKVYIKEYKKIYSAEDTGGAIKGNKIDIYYEDKDFVDRFGRKTLNIYVLK
ncbi:3D domain-containing protein [Peptostreptococcaceae bacterium AGR-M142]